jgi:hypothetical protein
MAGMLPTTSEAMIAASSASTPKAEMRVRLRNSISNAVCRFRRASCKNIDMVVYLSVKKQWAQSANNGSSKITGA